MRCKGLACLSAILTSAIMAAIPRLAHAVTTSFEASGGKLQYSETVYVTFSDTASRWKTTDFHADGILGTSQNYDLYGIDAGNQGGMINFPYSHAILSAAAKGHYMCWAVAHGTSSGGNWDAGVTSVNITVTS